MGKGGAERYAADVSIALQNLGHEVILVVFESKNEYRFLTDKIDYRVSNSFVQPSISKNHTIETSEFDDLVDEFDPDIIHSHLFKTEMTTRQRVLDDVTYVTTCQNNMPEFSNLTTGNLTKKSTWTRQYEKQWMIKKYRACKNNFIAISKDTKEFYKTVLPQDLAQNISLIYHAIDFKKFNEANRYRADDLDHVRLVYAARYAPYKNHIFLVDVVKHLVRLNKPVSLVLLGDGSEKTKVERRVKELALEENIKILGNVANVEDYLGDANIYVHPATYEPFGLVIIEAMAVGLPAICLDGKGNRDLIENGKNGYMLMEENAVAFAEKIIEFVEKPNAYRDMSNYAVDYAKQFDINVHARKLTKYYLSCIKEKISGYMS